MAIVVPLVIAVTTKEPFMMFHASIPAVNPQQVAELIAKLWNGEAFRFPPWPGAWVAMAGDDRSTTVEVYPRDQAMAPGIEQKDGAWAKVEKPIDNYIPFHVAIATVLAEEEVMALAQEQGWRSLRCSGHLLRRDRGLARQLFAAGGDDA